MFIAHYGVDHPKKVPEIAAKAEASRVRTMMARYGVRTPMEAGLVPTSRTRPEQAVEAMRVPGLWYTGDHSYWVALRTAEGRTRARNPDFVFYRPEQLTKVEAGSPPNEVRTGRVVEVLGDHWHGLAMTGLSREDYVSARTAEYASVGLKSLFVWESEVNDRPDAVAARLREFLDVGATSSGGDVLDLFG